MPANHQKPAAPTPASPRNTAKYTNKDGSKFITVPKGAQSDSSQPSTPTAARPSAQPEAPAEDDAAAPAVNRKKQKRRQKAAAKAAAELAANGESSPAHRPGQSSNHIPADHEIVVSDDEVEYIMGGERDMSAANGHASLGPSSKKGKKKKKRNVGPGHVDDSPLPPIEPEDLHSHPASLMSRGPGISRDKIWSTSNHEERERIKEFWLGLGEDERKSLVKVEKDAVLKKMKEQQKHTCSCTVCGRKRTAIEEELEGLYDAYYLELEQFANQGEGPPMLPPPRDFPPIRPPRGLRSGYAGQPPSRGRIVEHVGDEDDEEEIEEVYSEDEVEDDDYSDDEPPEEFHSPHDRDVADFLTFGNSLQVKGGILTVADDLLKNDGKRFIEMMEQLAERRMAREEDAREHFSRGYGHPNGSYSAPHNHPPPEEDDYDEEEDEEDDYEDSQDDEYEDEEDQMTEEQRMEEGRRMFQIFAARMFEQRVLSAYKEKVAKERQQKLIEELEEESRQVDQQKAKKAKNAQKKKDKAAQKKQALAEEKARKEAEKAAEEAARLEAEQRRAAEQKQKAEEKRKQRDAQKKAEEEARLKKEAERQRQREKQAEQERKAREAKDREKRLKEEQRLKDKDAKEQKEREAQERKDKQDRDKRDKEARAAKALKDAQETREAKEKAKEEKAALRAAAQPAPPTQPSQPAKRGPQHPISIPTVLPQHPSNPASYASPKIPVATPAIPKAPTPMRSRTTSQQYDTAPQPVSAASPKTMTPVSDSTSPGPGQAQQHQQRKVSGGSQASLPPPSQSVSPPGQHKGPGQSTPFHMSPLGGMQPPPGLAHQPPPGFPNRMSHDGMFPGFRPGPGMMMPPPPGINGSAGRGFPPMPMPPPGFTQGGAEQYGMNQGFPMPKDAPIPTHTRQGSASFDAAAAQPIGRPAPIGRPGSVVHGRSGDEDEDTKHLGSRALLDDDEPLADDFLPGSLPGSLRNQPPGPRGFGGGGSFIDNAFPPMGHNPWGPPAGGAHPFPPPGFGAPGWGAPGAPPGFGSPVAGLSSIRPPVQPRHVAVRLMLSQTCKDLSGSGAADNDGYIDLGTIKSRIESQTGDPSITEQDLLNLCDTEGSPSNGGGTFDVRRDASGQGKQSVRWVADPNDGMNLPYRPVGAPGEIGSPLMGHATLRGI